MRVVGGEWRGRPLVAPAGRATRPTSDKVREAIFDILAAQLAHGARPDGGAGASGDAEPAGPFAGLDVLDLYAGSGALGIEALSRGAARCTFVERHGAALAALRRNLASLGVGEERARVVPRAVGAALTADAREGVQYTLLLADPPYGRYARSQAELAPLMGVVLAQGGLAVVETARGEPVDLPLRVVRHKRYGDTQVTVLVRDGADPGEESCPAK